MNDLAIRADRLCKSYRLYDAPKYRLLDILGLSRQASVGIREHRALSDVTFEIRKGEKVGIIGRNGAGKSTLLKLVTKVIAPTSGLLDIRGATQALLSLGTGFHPEFTGRQNANAYLASLGFSGAQLDNMVEEAIAFAELDDFADQPTKTYSTGMGMRLMFAAATMIRPDLLVIDEVLGVGDAYFQQKSFQHIRDICSAKQTTLLLVTHDIYNAAQLCDRMMWIDRGRLLIDATPDVVVRAYEDSIREQEERRLRAKTLSFGRREGATRRLLVDIQSVGNQPPKAPLYVARISVLIGGVQVASVPLDEAAFEQTGEAFLVREGSNWGDVAQWHGRLARPFRNYGSPFHKVTAAFDLPLKPGDENQVAIRIESWSEGAGNLLVRAHGVDFERVLGRLSPPAAEWTDIMLTGNNEDASEDHTTSAATSEHVRALSTETFTSVPTDCSMEGSEVTTDTLTLAEPSFALAEPPAAHVSPLPAPQSDVAQVIRLLSPSLNITGVYGTGDVELLGLRMIGGDQREHHLFQVGDAVTFALDYRLRRPDLAEKLNVVVVFRRDGIVDVMRLFLEDILFDAKTRPEGTLKARFDRLPLSPGQYSITVLVAREGYYRSHQAVFFSMNPGVYCAHVGLMEMAVDGTSQLYAGTGVVVDAHWSLD